jgi:hypothetical protein
MTRIRLRITILLIILIYLIAILFGIYLFYNDTHEPKDKTNYIIYKDLIPLIIAIPAAYLVFCFQRRSNFLITLRQVWTDIVISVNNARQYILTTNPTEKDYNEALSKLSISIDQVRVLYKNIEETRTHQGLYAYESLKTIYSLIQDCRPDILSKNSSSSIKDEIDYHWKNLRNTHISIHILYKNLFLYISAKA